MAETLTPKKSSPLDGRPGPSAGITLVERPFVGKVDLRGDVADAAFSRAARGVLGVDLPTEPNTTVEAGANVVFWLGPDEWLIHTPEDGQAGLTESLRAGLSGVHAAVTDVSDYSVVMRLAGPEARNVLAKGSPFDVHARVFAVGACAQTRFANASILLRLVDDEPTFDIQVRWSFAPYFWDYLVDAAKEFETS